MPVSDEAKRAAAWAVWEEIDGPLGRASMDAEFKALSRAEQDGERFAVGLEAAQPHLEGEGALRELLSWVEKERADETERQSEASGPFEDMRGGAVSAFEQTATRIRSMLPEKVGRD